MIPPQPSSRPTVFAPHFALSGFIGLNRITAVALNAHGFLSSPRLSPSPHIHPLYLIRTGTFLIPTILFSWSSDAGTNCPRVLSIPPPPHLYISTITLPCSFFPIKLIPIDVALSVSPQLQPQYLIHPDESRLQYRECAHTCTICGNPRHGRK
jgi:hypothetical protein